MIDLGLDRPILRTQLAQAYEALGEFERALEELGRAEELLPADPDHARIRARIEARVEPPRDSPGDGEEQGG